MGFTPRPHAGGHYYIYYYYIWLLQWANRGPLEGTHTAYSFIDQSAWLKEFRTGPHPVPIESRDLQPATPRRPHTHRRVEPGGGALCVTGGWSGAPGRTGCCSPPPHPHPPGPPEQQGTTCKHTHAHACAHARAHLCLAACAFVCAGMHCMPPGNGVLAPVAAPALRPLRGAAGGERVRRMVRARGRPWGVAP